MIKTIVLLAKNISLPLGGTAITYVADAGIQRKIQGKTLLEETGTDAANSNAIKKNSLFVPKKKSDIIEVLNELRNLKYF